MTSSLGCVRKAVLEERFPGTSNAKAVEGTLLHDLLQVCHQCLARPHPYLNSTPNIL